MSGISVCDRWERVEGEGAHTYCAYVCVRERERERERERSSYQLRHLPSPWKQMNLRRQGHLSRTSSLKFLYGKKVAGRGDQGIGISQ